MLIKLEYILPSVYIPNGYNLVFARRSQVLIGLVRPVDAHNLGFRSDLSQALDLKASAVAQTPDTDCSILAETCEFVAFAGEANEPHLVFVAG
jgi:hypothetical protein